MADGPMVDRAWERIRKAEQERDAALEVLGHVLEQCCLRHGDGTLDSTALTAYAEGLQLMAVYGRFIIEAEHGRRVIGRWVRHAA